MDSKGIRVVDGYFDSASDDVGSLFNGIYDHKKNFVSDAFLLFEHTDGLNYVYAEIASYDDISSVFGIQNTDKFQIEYNYDTNKTGNTRRFTRNHFHF